MPQDRPDEAKGIIHALGSLPADAIFRDRARQAHNAALCSYRDQDLIHAKALGFNYTVNVTLELPFIGTSAEHGNAFDIAGRGLARTDSLGAGVRMAQQLAVDAGTKGGRSRGGT